MEADLPLSIPQLQQLAREVRRDILKMIAAAGSGHPGGSLSLVELLVALYFNILRVNPGDPRWPHRDRLVLSKGHAAPALYAVLAARGFFSRSKLEGLRRLGSELQGHPDMNKVPGVDMSTGSLGQGLSVATGMALAARLDRADWRVYAILGDGECQEGQVWEAALAAAHYRLGHLTAILDWNGLQIDGPTDRVISLEPLSAKWESFGWQVRAVDGHNFAEILEALDRKAAPGDKPLMVIARTVKGKGVSFMENRGEWHGVAPSPQELEKALAELENTAKEGAC